MKSGTMAGKLNEMDKFVDKQMAKRRSELDKAAKKSSGKKKTTNKKK